MSGFVSVVMDTTFLSQLQFVCEGLSLTETASVQGGGRLCDALQASVYAPGMRWGVLPLDAGPLQVVSATHWDLLRLVSIAIQEMQIGSVSSLWAAHDALKASQDIIKELTAPACAMGRARMQVGGSAVADPDLIAGLASLVAHLIIDPLAVRMDGSIASAQHATDCGEGGADAHLMHGMLTAYRTGQLTFLRTALDSMSTVPGGLLLVETIANAMVRVLADVYHHSCLFYGVVNKTLCQQLQRGYSTACDVASPFAAPEHLAHLTSQQEFSEFTMTSIVDKRLPITVVPPFVGIEDLRPEDS